MNILNEDFICYQCKKLSFEEIKEENRDKMKRVHHSLIEAELEHSGVKLKRVNSEKIIEDNAGPIATTILDLKKQLNIKQECYYGNIYTGNYLSFKKKIVLYSCNLCLQFFLQKVPKFRLFMDVIKKVPGNNTKALWGFSNPPLFVFFFYKKR